MQPLSSIRAPAVDVVDSSSAATPSSSSGLSSWTEIKQLSAAVTVTPLDSDAQQRNRKRQRPSAPSSPGDLKLDFQVDSARYATTDDVPTFLKSLQLAQDAAALTYEATTMLAK